MQSKTILQSNGMAPGSSMHHSVSTLYNSKEKKIKTRGGRESSNTNKKPGNQDRATTIIFTHPSCQSSDTP